MSQTAQKKHAWPKIRERGSSWQVDCGVAQGKRIQLSYKSRPEAEAAAAQFRQDRRLLGQTAFALTQEQRQIAVEAFKVLTGFPDPTLIDAARFFIEHYNPDKNRKKVDEVLAEFLDSKKAAEKAKHTLLDYRHRLGRFAKAHGTADVQSITVQALEKWLNQNKMHGLNRANYQRHLRIYFNYAVKRGYCKTNPALALERVPTKEVEPVIMPIEQVYKLLEAATAKAPAMIPYLTLGLFAGIRPDEIKALDWRNVNFDRQEIKVTAGSAKTRSARYVKMTANLIEWLLPHRQAQGLIFFSRKLFDGTRKAAGVTWANDIMRHTYASHHCPIYGTDDTADQLGHKGKSVLFKHYRRAISETEAKLFWEIRPVIKDNILMFKTA
jgi:site-specific recombinase XerC